MTGYILRHEAHLRAVMEEQLRLESSEQIRIRRKRLERNENRIAELKRLFIRIYEDNACGRLSDERFDMLSLTYETEQKQLETECVTLRQEIEVQERQNENVEKFIQTAHKYVGIDKLDGYALRELVSAIYEQGVPSPGRYLYDIGLRKTEKFKNAIWYLQTIKKILVDPVYLGWIVSGKYRSQLCERGTKTTVKTPEEEWIINKGMHEPIVSKELFDKVQDILSARQSEQGLATIYDSKSKRRSMFKGILRCGECGRSMYLRSKSNRGYYYYCTLHENYNATICPKKAVKQEDVESLALRLIQTQIRAFSDAQRLIANLNATPSSQTRYQIYETQIDDAKRKIEKFNQLKAALYGDFADGLLSHQDYTDLSEDYSRRADDLRIFIAELEKEKEKYSVGFGSKMQWALLIEKYKDQESLDAEMAAAFIETLTLFNDGHVEVAFRHRDEIEQVLYVAATRGKEAERYAG